MKVLFLGEIGTGQTSLMRMRALARLGFSVEGLNTVETWQRASWVRRQIQRRLQIGSIIDRLNDLVLRKAKRLKPDLVWAEKQEYLDASTVEELKRQGAFTIHFTPDPYFSLEWKRTRRMDDAISRFDALVFCKAYEKKDYSKIGPAVSYMPLGYCDETHRPMPGGGQRWICDVGFVGGWEPRRSDFLDLIAKRGVNLKIWGAYWDFLKDGKWTLRRSIILRQLAGRESFEFERRDGIANALQGGEVLGQDYARALSNARIGVGFLRTTWPDQHTTRTFEIPGCGSMLLADRTEEHQGFFEEGREAVFFSSAEEFVEKCVYYTSHESVRAKIALAGMRRCMLSRYAYVYRVSDALRSFGISAPTSSVA